MRALTALVVCMLTLGSLAQAASSLPFYFVERPTVNMILSEELESEEQKGEFINSKREAATSRQEFDIRTRGWIYHPALLIFSAGLRPEFKQQSVYADAGYKQSDDATFLGYFVDTTFLQIKPYTLNLYAGRDKSEYTSSLAPDSTTESNVYRGRLFLKYPVLPTNLMLESRDRVTESFFSYSDKTDRFRLESEKKTSKSITRLNTELLQQSRTIRGSEFSGERMFMLVTNQYSPRANKNVYSVFRYSDNTSGLIDSATTALSSQLSVRHRDNLETRYRLGLEDRAEQGFDAKRSNGSASLSHHLYENLTTSLSADVEKSDLPGGSLDSYGAGVDFGYVRRIPWGDLNINLGHREQITDDQRLLGISEIRDESHVLSGIVLTELDNIAIDIDSLILTDVTGTIIYVEGIDYTLIEIGNTVQIARTLFGNIADGEEVLADYRFEADPPAKIATITDTFGVNVSLWSVLRIYYQKNQSKEKLLSGIMPDELMDGTTQRVGAELRWKWNTASVDVEDREGTRTPMKILRIRDSLSFRPTRNLSFGAGADYSELELKDTGERSEGYGYTANLRWDLGLAGQFSADAFTQQVRGLAQRSERKGLRTIYQWKYGAWHPSIRYTLIDENDQLAAQSRKTNTLFFTIARRFQ